MEYGINKQGTKLSVFFRDERIKNGRKNVGIIVETETIKSARVAIGTQIALRMKNAGQVKDRQDNTDDADTEIKAALNRIFHTDIIGESL